MVSIVTIIAPAASAALTTLAMAKAELGITDVYSDDGYVGGLIDRASAVVARYCQRTFGLQTISEAFRQSDLTSSGYPAPETTILAGNRYHSRTQPLILTQQPAQSITSVVESNVTLTAGTDFEADLQAGMLWRLSGDYRTGWLPLTTVIYTSGWVLPQDSGTRTLPFDVEEVTLSLIRAAYSARGYNPKISREIVEGVGRVDYALAPTVSGMDLDANSKQMLAPYVIRGIW